MERLNEQPVSRGLTGAMLRTWGYLFLVLGVAARAVIQNHMLGMVGKTNLELLQTLQQSDASMALASASLVMQALEACAVPIFAFLLVEGFYHTGDFMKYLLRVLLVAVVSEIPYNLAMQGNWLHMSSRNPVFGLALGLVILWFYRYYSGKSAKSVFIKILVAVAAMLWCMMLGIEHGAFTVLMVITAYLTRGKQMRILIGCIVAAAGTALSMLYLAAPFGFLAVHFYNGEKGESNRTFNLVCYPLLLLAAWGVTMLL